MGNCHKQEQGLSIFHEEQNEKSVQSESRDRDVIGHIVRLSMNSLPSFAEITSSSSYCAAQSYSLKTIVLPSASSPTGTTSQEENVETFANDGSVQGMKRELAKYESETPNIFMDYVNERGETLLMTACKLGHYGLIKYLISRYMEYKNAIFDSMDPLYGRSVSVLVLDFMGDYINYECNFGKSSLIHGLSCKHLCRVNIARFLLKSGASTKGNPEYGKAPFHYAVEWRNYDLIQVLLDYGSDINEKNGRNGYTALMMAAKFNDRSLCEYLLLRHADKSLKDKNGKNAAELALESKCWSSLLAIDHTLVPSAKLK